MPALVRFTLTSLLMALSLIAQAGSLPASARAEIESVLDALKSSGCQFNRNGTWYSGTQAQAHLTKKLVYLADKDLIQSAEEFIEKGATTSSASGKPYQVRCGTAAAVDGKAWLQDQLKTLRAAGR
jgi:hypothetical protein